MKIILFASKYIGKSILDFFTAKHPQDLLALVHLPDDREILAHTNMPTGVRVYDWKALSLNSSDYFSLEPDLVVIAWWPQLIQAKYFAHARLGAINTHNSLLPFGRGVHANYWAIKNKERYGATIHRAVDKIDAGNIVAQTQVDYDWTDTGHSLYWKGLRALSDLFENSYDKLETLIHNSKPQNVSDGSIYYLKDMKDSFRIELDKEYVARDLFNSVRAKQFPGSPPSFFYDGGVKYEITISIKKSEDSF